MYTSTTCYVIYQIHKDNYTYIILCLACMHVGTYIEPATDQPAINIYINSLMKSFSSFSAIDKRKVSPKEF